MDLGQNTLFGQKVISSINYNEQELIKDILYLHADGNNIELDPCYSVGNFYKKGLVKPKHKFDKFPQTRDTIFAESNNLPMNDKSVSVIMFDPPFIINGEATKTDNIIGIIGKRFTAFKDWKELKDMYLSSITEFYRILKDGGILIFKCQDIVSSGKQHFTHSWLMYEAIKLGYYPKDLFILLSKNRLTDGRKQQHARKFHSYFWVFQKTKCKTDYS